MARQFVLTNKKVRGIPRRLRALKRWADSFEGSFPDEAKVLAYASSNNYIHWKIPVHRGLVEGKHANSAVVRQCLQELLNACQKLIQAKPKHLTQFRVTCVLCTPNYFSSEICIYLSEEYFQGHTNGPCVAAHISNRLGLQVPIGMQEIGIDASYTWEKESFVGEQWFFGEVQ
jgi:hypothetical protein